MIDKQFSFKLTKVAGVICSSMLIFGALTTSAQAGTTVVGAVGTIDLGTVTAADLDAGVNATLTQVTTNTGSIASNATEIGINTNSIASNAAMPVLRLALTQITQLQLPATLLRLARTQLQLSAIVSNCATEIENRVSKGVSMSMAMDGIPQAFGGQSVIGVGIGRFNGHSALAIGGSYHDDENGITYSIKAARSTGGNATNAASAGVGWAF